jgi:hypothetical protein
MAIGRGNRSTHRNPAPMLLCPPQIPRDLIWARNRAAAVGIRQLASSTECLLHTEGCWIWGV